MGMTTDALANPLVRASSLREGAQLPDFDALFLVHYDGVYRLLYRIVGTREEAEDLAQETFLRLARQRFPADRQHNVRAWLYRVATNLAYNALRGQGRRERHQEAAQQVVTAGSPALDLTEAVQRSDEREAVRRALGHLPARQAQLLLLRHAGLSYRELAEALNVAPGSVGTLLARAEAAFEKVYREGGGNEV
jgi:RNA polymerase sigma-70 factor (ECF subfamily)